MICYPVLACLVILVHYIVLFLLEFVRRLPLLISIKSILWKKCVPCRGKRAQFEDIIIIQIVAANTQVVARRHERPGESR